MVIKMISDNNIKFLSRYGSKSTLHDIVDNHGLSGSMINNIGNNPNADPEIGSKIKAKEGFLYAHQHNLYAPSESFEHTLYNNTAIESYLDHPKHTEDDLIHLGEKYKFHGITFRPRNAGKKVFEHMLSKGRNDFVNDLVQYSKNPEIHEAVLEVDHNKHSGLTTRLAWNSHVSPENQIRIIKDSNSRLIARDMLIRHEAHPDVVAEAVRKFPRLSSVLVYHHGHDRERFKKAFEIMDSQNKNLYQDAHKEFLE